MKPYGLYMSAGARLITRNVTSPTWLAGSSYSEFSQRVHDWNTYLPLDPKKAATFIRKRRKAKLLISKGQDVSDFEECYLPMVLGPYADGGEPFTESDERMLKEIEEREAVQDVTAH
jgi:hypothetical protein